MRNVFSNAFGNAFRTDYGTREETSGECARTRARHQTPEPEPITASHGSFVAPKCPALTTDRAREAADMEENSINGPAAASRAGADITDAAGQHERNERGEG